MIDRALPQFVEGYGRIDPFDSIRMPPAAVTRASTRIAAHARGREKLLDDIEAAFVASGVSDGATLSFHHHLRNGDHVLNQVLAVAARRGLRELTIAASSVFPVHAPLIGHMRSGVVTRLTTAYMSGPVAEAVSRGALRTPVVMTTHGGRARAIEAGELHIDVAFIAAPAVDRHGNVSGAQGRAACGPLGYAMVDAQYADWVVAVTDQLWSQPPCPVDIPQDQVDFVVEVDSIGDPKGILSGTTRPTSEPVGLQIASTAAQVIAASGLLREGFSLPQHADTAAGANLALVTTRLASSAGPKIVERVGCLTTPGETIDAVVTEAGVAVHPARADLKDRLLSAGIEVQTIEALRARAGELAPGEASAGSPRDDSRIVAVVEYRDGRVTDVVRQVSS